MNFDTNQVLKGVAIYTATDASFPFNSSSAVALDVGVSFATFVIDDAAEASAYLVQLPSGVPVGYTLTLAEIFGGGVGPFAPGVEVFDSEGNTMGKINSRSTRTFTVAADSGGSLLWIGSLILGGK